jgi:hypothetical protein
MLDTYEVNIPVVESYEAHSRNKMIIYTATGLTIAAILLFFGGYSILGTSVIFVAILIASPIYYGQVEYSVEGAVVLSKDKLIVQIGPELNFYLMNLVSNIEIRCNEYEGELRYIGKKVVRKNGINNYIAFQYGEKYFSYEILLKQEQLRAVNNMFDIWRNNEREFKIRNRWGRKIKWLREDIAP